MKVEVAVHFRNKCDGFGGRKATLNLNSDTQSSGAVWKSRWPSLIVLSSLCKEVNMVLKVYKNSKAY